MASQAKAEHWYSPKVLQKEDWQNYPFSIYRKARCFTALLTILLCQCCFALYRVHTTVKILSSQRGVTHLQLDFFGMNSAHWYLQDAPLVCSRQCLALDHSSLKQMLKNTICFILKQNTSHILKMEHCHFICFPYIYAISSVTLKFNTRISSNYAIYV